MPSHTDLLAATPKCEACGNTMRCDHERKWWECGNTVHAGRKLLRYWSRLVEQQNGEE